MDLNTFFITLLIIFGISLVMAIIVAIAGCVCLKPDEMLRKVFPYIKKSGSQIVIFDCLIDRFSVKFLYFYLTHVVTITLADILFNALVTTSSMYNPYDGLDCLGILYNGTIIELTSEEQAEMDEVISILCMGWNFNFAVAIGHIVAVLTLSWILVSIVLWIKIKLGYKIINCIINGNQRLGLCSFCIMIWSQLFFSLCTAAATMGAIMFFFPKGTLDILLICTILNSGLAILTCLRKPKSLADHCKEAVEGRQGEEEEALVPIKDRLRRTRGHPIQVDRLKEQAELECKKALADIEEERYNISEDEMQTIAQVAYRKVTTNDGGAQYNNGQQYNTRQGASINDPTERDRLLGDTRRNNNNYLRIT